MKDLSRFKLCCTAGRQDSGTRQGRAERFPRGGGGRSFFTSMKKLHGRALLLKTKSLGGGQPPSPRP